MNSTFIGAGLDALTERWWVPVIRGIAAIVFGVLALVSPAIGLFALVIMWALYALADGVFNLMLAGHAGRAGTRWGWYLFEAIVSIAAGVLTFVYPGITAMVLVFVIATWAILTGVIEIAAAIELRHVVRGEWMLALAGVLSVAFGVLLFAFPGAGALALVWLIGSYAIVFGLLLIGLGVRLRRWGREGERVIPTGGVPTPA
jgi:uncharacterized membrane protein HdeD (DUF308 family)